MLISMIRLHDQIFLQLAKNSTEVSAECRPCFSVKSWQPLVSKLKVHRSCAHRWQMRRPLRALAQSVGSAGRCVRDGWAQCLLRGPHDWSCPASHPLQALPLCHWQECWRDPSHTKPELIMRECLACHVHCVLCAQHECRVIRCFSGHDHNLVRLHTMPVGTCRDPFRVAFRGASALRLSSEKDCCKYQVVCNLMLQELTS